MAADVRTEEERVRSWRLELLLRLGYPQPDAEQIADATCDVHYVEALIRRGATLAEAARIALP